jgi:hypothetical protein
MVLPSPFSLLPWQATLLIRLPTLCLAAAPRAHVVAVALAAIAAAGCRDTRPPVEDPMPGVPLTQQRTISQSDLGHEWPFTVGTGTIVCDGGALSFRAAGTTYALSKGAGTRGFADINTVTRRQGSGPPSDPVGSVKQDVRMKIFADVSACGAAVDAVSRACRARVRERYQVTESDLTRIEAEGAERYWPPLELPFMSLDPVIAMARQLCPP